MEIAEAPARSAVIYLEEKVTKRCIAAVAFVFLLVFAAKSPAQTTTTSLRGVIKDPSGAVIPGAKVTISNAANGQKFTATSDASGRLRLRLDSAGAATPSPPVATGFAQSEQGCATAGEPAGDGELQHDGEGGIRTW